MARQRGTWSSTEMQLLRGDSSIDMAEDEKTVVMKKSFFGCLSSSKPTRRTLMANRILAIACISALVLFFTTLAIVMNTRAMKSATTQVELLQQQEITTTTASIIAGILSSVRQELNLFTGMVGLQLNDTAPTWSDLEESAAPLICRGLTRTRVSSIGLATLDNLLLSYSTGQERRLLIHNSTNVDDPYYFGYANNATGMMGPVVYTIATLNWQLNMLNCAINSTRTSACHTVYFGSTMTPALHIAAAQPMLDLQGNRIAYMFTSSTMETLSKVMLSLLENPIQQRAFVVDENLDLITSTHGAHFTCSPKPSGPQNSCSRIQPSQSNDTIIAQSGELLSDLIASGMWEQWSDSYLLTVSPLTLEDGNTWYVCLVSTSLSTSQPYMNAYHAAMLSATWLLPCALLLTILVTFIVTAPLANALHVQQELAESNLQLEKTRKEAEEAAASRFRYIANMSHEIKTPLASILGALQVMFESPLVNSADRNLRSTVEHSAVDLLHHLDDILDLHKMEISKTLFLAESQFRPIDSVNHVLRSWGRAVDDKNIELVLDADPNVESLVAVSDPTRFRQVLTNLLSNAIKFTDVGGTIVITMSAKELPFHWEGNGQPLPWPGVLLKFDIMDSGVGIPKAFQESMFGHASQNDESNTRSYEGSGIGLRVVRYILTAMRGNVQLISREGVGTTARVEVVLQRVSADDEHEAGYSLVSAPSAAIAPPPSVFESPRVLVAMRTRRAAAVVRSRLQEFNINSDCFSTVAMTISAIQSTAYSVLVIDDCLIDDLRRAITDSTFQDMAPHHVVWLLEAPGDHARVALELKATDPIIVKPLVAHTLAELMQRLLNTTPSAERTLRHHLHANTSSPGAFPRLKDIMPDDQAAPAFFGESSPLILLAEDNPALQRLMKGMLMREGCRVDAVGNGRDASLNVERGGVGKYSLVIMDLQMPIMDGFLATGAIRQWESRTPGAGHLPIVALSALSASDAELLKTLESGFDAYLSKPVSRSDLVQMLLRHILPPPPADEK